MTKPVLTLQFFISADMATCSDEIGWSGKSHKYGSKGAFTRDWKKSFRYRHHRRARLVNTTTGEVVWENPAA